MTAQRREEIMSHIQDLKTKLEHWKSQPMMLEVEELTRISQELKIDDIHHRKY